MMQDAIDWVTPEMFGAKGTGDPAHDDGPAFRDAIAACKASGIRRIVCRPVTYAVRHTARTSGLGDIHGDYDGHGLVIDSQITIESAGARTDIHFYAPSGEPFAEAWDVIDGQVWRGSGIFLRGHPVDPGKARRNALTLRGVHIHGTAGRTGTHTWPANPATGDGWDVTHKGVHAENDYYIGDIALIGSGIHSFRGELWYMAGAGNGGMIARNVELSDSNANGFNPTHVEFTDIDGFYVHDVFQGWEGLAGKHGRLVNGMFKDCGQVVRLQGGNVNGHANVYYLAPQRAVASEVPWLEVGFTAIDCGDVMIGAFVRGWMRLVDTRAYLGPIDQGDNFHDVSLKIDAIADQKSFDAVTLYSVDADTGRIRLEIRCDRTAHAAAAGHGIQSPFVGAGALGRDVEIVNGSGPVERWDRGALTGWPGNKPLFSGNTWQLVSLDETRGDVLAVSADAVLAPHSSHLLIFAGSPGPFAIGLETAGYARGTELTIYCSPDAGAQFVFTDGSGNLKLRAASHTLSGKRISFRFDGRHWLETGVEA